jgi:hypothetical protein
MVRRYGLFEVGWSIISFQARRRILPARRGHDVSGRCVRRNSSLPAMQRSRSAASAFTNGATTFNLARPAFIPVSCVTRQRGFAPARASCHGENRVHGRRRCEKDCPI